ncbi:PREDICTED: LEAF RUST 10 DISEASE-RESISTANCE LOCUS RECEPTOR-LIKE PROTEIN KINASE-like 2.1 [Nelumbo nucifera]|uniref:Protein kinase domain-containing protein n=2 Tax=Nelumbo nucifera TaxID=4432 RepID=A0A822YIA6_NELNU|nr:PREDICTED: LEAF RUST 10 DISEASE-RESISTANCE LOCUS RECEPTOR-LIKE PROTEIN KINASE-like 2.1 [Nelumbo nucifera]DAD31853.1 TPA_asm: hypothetical protein HUJ06_010704 [Nelumbo nucifera]
MSFPSPHPWESGSNVPHSESPCFSRYNGMFSFFLFLFFSVLSVERVLCVDPRFGTCKPQICGNQNISYPFWINDTKILPDYCGYPGFEISCKSDKPMLKISGNDYMIQEINNQTQSVRVTYQGAADDYCPSPLYNVSLDRTPFGFDYDHAYLFIFFNCSSLLDDAYSRYRINCTPHDYTFSPLTLFEGDPELNSSYLFQECDKSVLAPVEKEIGDEIFQGKMYQEILNKGFLLRWNAANCSDCLESGGQCGFDWKAYKFTCLCRDRPRMMSCRDDKKSWRRIALGISAAGVIAGSVLVICIVLRRKSKDIDVNNRKNNGDTEVVYFKNYGYLHYLAPKRYRYSQVKKITNSFKDKLGQGGYGYVYRGKLFDGQLVAVKVLSESKGNGEEFINEVASISRTSHVNVVTLLGFCFEGKKRALIYEFMPNGSLEKFIYEGKFSQANRHLGWERLHQIAIGIARGLEYLHRGCNTRILHFDIKPHNILLDQDFCPKISDFGLAKLCPDKKESVISMQGARGTAGYIAPEVFSRNFGGVSHKSDVYSYGMMVLEMVGGRKNIDVGVDNTSEIYFPHWIYKRLGMDEDLGLCGDITTEEEEIVRKMSIVGLWCIQIDPSSRPSMSKVVEMLEGSLNSLQIPPKPFLSSPSRSRSRPTSPGGSPVIEESCSMR